MFDEDLALVRAPRRQDHVLLEIHILVHGVVKPGKHDGAALRAGEVRELVPDALVLNKAFIV